MIEPERLQLLNDRPPDHQPPKAAKYVLYWMQASQRERFNPALEYAASEANRLALPLLVCFGLMDDYPEANERHYLFMLQGLRDVQLALEKRGIRFVVKHGPPPAVALHYAKHAALVVCDRGYTRHQRAWRDQLADALTQKLVQVEGDIVVPVETASDKHEWAARTIRPKIHKHLSRFLAPLPRTILTHPSLNLNVKGDLDVSAPPALLKKLKLDRSVPPSPTFQGGQTQAHLALKHFLAQKLKGYDEGRNEPAAAGTSFLSMFLHYGHISPVEIVLAVRDSAAPKPDIDAYVEELVVRRELSMNFCHFEPNYDTYDALPTWAKQSLEKHARDTRPHLYTRDQLEAAQTRDPYWNAAQLEMVKTGFMHNYMRMYWGKKILEWTPTPQEAFNTTLYLNNKYFLCGRDPNAWANVAWIFGLHDRPWGPERQVFGLVRYMNAKGLERKFNIQAYTKKIASL